MHTKGNDPGRPEGTSPHPSTERNEENPGYEVQDVNVGGILVFLAGLGGFLAVFFLLCYGMGKVINIALDKQDGPTDRWHAKYAPEQGKRGESLASNPAIEQAQLAKVTGSFPTPRLDTDDGNQATADLHAREDLLLEHYSTIDGNPGAVRIPIDRAMELIAQRGLPVVAAGATENRLAEDKAPMVHAPLTTGFARTGYELDTIEAREQKLSYHNAEAAEKASTK